MENATELNIIIVDDDPDDHYLYRKAIKSINQGHLIEHVYSGSQLMEMFFEKGQKRTDIDLPDIILLDLNMPNVDGYKVLSEMNKNKEFTSIEIYIMSSSPYEKDMLKWKELGVTDFFVKPYQFEKLRMIFESILTRKKTLRP